VTLPAVPHPTSEFDCEERVISTVDENGGVARRWTVTHRATGVMRLVILMRPDGGRWAAAPALLCSCLAEGCAHLARVREEIFHSFPPAA
jgi:hypothetical protein